MFGGDTLQFIDEGTFLRQPQSWLRHQAQARANIALALHTQLEFIYGNDNHLQAPRRKKY
jgi:hypothetical protein